MNQLLRFFVVFFLVIITGSCDHISFKKEPKQVFNDSLDVTQVDKYPSFPACDSIIDKEKKAACFRNTIYQEISKSLSSQQVKVKRPVDETIQVVITIHSDQRIELKSMEASDSLLTEIPDLKAIIQKSILGLPKVFPAIKKDIPVTSEYKLPIKISLKN